MASLVALPLNHKSRWTCTCSSPPPSTLFLNRSTHYPDLSGCPAPKPHTLPQTRPPPSKKKRRIGSGNVITADMRVSLRWGQSSCGIQTALFRPRHESSQNPPAPGPNRLSGCSRSDFRALPRASAEAPAVNWQCAYFGHPR